MTFIARNPTGPARLVPTGRAALGVRWLVLLVILFGTLVSSVGGMNSHGIAAIASAAHAAAPGERSGHDLEHGHSHGHSHEDEDLAWDTTSAGLTADHPHHGADHSHDKAHAVPGAWASAAVPLPGWRWHVLSWPETMQPYRLERPPMG
ncbi:MAG: hypothetical protein MUF55_00035 [Hydrogenophaga sp.]|nr:hypothetical protein [Hydrogenophaga sp.]